jgi:hypothetical protein
MTTEQQRIILIDEPSPYDTLETWERHLDVVEKLPENTLLKDRMLARARKRVEEKRAEQVH